MSNFYPSKFIINANIIGYDNVLEAETAEQAIMWFKGLLMGDKIRTAEIVPETNPANCKNKRS